MMSPFFIRLSTVSFGLCLASHSRMFNANLGRNRVRWALSHGSEKVSTGFWTSSIVKCWILENFTETTCK